MRGKCYDSMIDFVEPRNPWETRKAIEMCHECPLLMSCRDMAAKHRWFFPTVVAGWQPPEPTNKKLISGGSLPPWTPSEFKRVDRVLTVRR